MKKTVPSHFVVFPCNFDHQKALLERIRRLCPECGISNSVQKEACGAIWVNINKPYVQHSSKKWAIENLANEGATILTLDDLYSMEKSYLCFGGCRFYLENERVVVEHETRKLYLTRTILEKVLKGFGESSEEKKYYILVHNQEHATAIANCLASKQGWETKVLDLISKNFSPFQMRKFNYIRFSSKRELSFGKLENKTTFEETHGEYKQISLDQLFLMNFESKSSVQIQEFRGDFKGNVVTFGCQSFTKEEVNQILELLN